MTNEDTTEETETAMGSDGEIQSVVREESDFKGWSQSDTSLSDMITENVSRLTKRPYVLIY